VLRMMEESLLEKDSVSSFPRADKFSIEIWCWKLREGSVSSIFVNISCRMYGYMRPYVSSCAAMFMSHEMSS